MQKLRNFGIVGTLIAALLCFTPILVVAFGAVGLSWVSGYLDYFLIPLMLILVSVVIYTTVQHRKNNEMT